MTETTGTPAFLDRGDGVALAFHHRPGQTPTLVFLPGYMSDMTGTKALMIDQWCAENGRACLRFDYSGCGQSRGDFEAGTISRWRDDTLALIDRLTDGPVILVGSSMGGWVALLAALARPERVKALVGIAAAPDFVDWGLWDELEEKHRELLMTEGRIERPSDHGPEPYVYTRQFVEDGRRHKLLDEVIPFDGPVRLLHGQRDADVPWALSLTIAEKLRSADVQVHLVKEGDHRLSGPKELDLLRMVLADLVEDLT